MLYGLLTLCFAEGLRRVLRTGAGSLLGTDPVLHRRARPYRHRSFVTDPALGYPTATPAVASLGGSIHNLTSPIVFIALPAACFVLVRRFARDKWRGWASYSIATALVATPWPTEGALAATERLRMIRPARCASGRRGSPYERWPLIERHKVSSPHGDPRARRLDLAL
ncbi:DUF998 domain-containing protein [Nonomuraea mangrovi]|uniref:DUF998 domain-containing protein n=1 Tax=Nonomuraea mangrovi TaxID=2316207 RepID=A0ABW4SSQ8_9ACTN